MLGENFTETRARGGAAAEGAAEGAERVLWWEDAVCEHWEAKRERRGGRFLGRRLTVRVLDWVSWDAAAAAEKAHLDPFWGEAAASAEGSAGDKKKADKKKRRRSGQRA